MDSTIVRGVVQNCASPNVRRALLRRQAPPDSDASAATPLLDDNSSKGTNASELDTESELPTPRLMDSSATHGVHADRRQQHGGTRGRPKGKRSQQGTPYQSPAHTPTASRAVSASSRASARSRSNHAQPFRMIKT